MIDFDAFNTELLNTDAFAQEATYIRQGFPAVLIPVIFENEFALIEGLGEAGVGSSSPVAYCKSSDVPHAARGDTLSVFGTTYHVVEVRPDGTGITLLILSQD